MMTQTSYERKCAARLAFCIANLAIYDDCGRYAVVPSASNPSAKPYIVGIDEQTLYATSCNCKAGQNNVDCVHALATDRALDVERDQRRRATRQVAEAVEIMEATKVMSTAYEVLAPTKDVTRCRHCNKPSRSGLCYRCNED